MLVIVLYWPFEFRLLHESPIPDLCSFFHLVILLSTFKDACNSNSFNHLTVRCNVNCFPRSITCLLCVYGAYVLLEVERMSFQMSVSSFISFRKKKTMKWPQRIKHRGPASCCLWRVKWFFSSPLLTALLHDLPALLKCLLLGWL